ncbi:MAG: hypothetical protein K1X81_13130 [Bacteroidia bacterium]|nr:hypothetical protein [Bacteroidia bacterium]
MKTKTLIFLTIISCLPLFNGCSLFEPDDAWLKPLPPSNTLPPATQVGANTFGCKLNGEVWLPITTWVDYEAGTLLITTEKKMGNTSSVKLYLKNIYKQGVFYIGDSTINFTRSTYVYNSKFYYTDSIYTGQLFITRFDTINSILSGTFWFDARDKTTGEVVHITEGRFDNKYN